MADAGIVIVGTGQAAYHLVASLRDEGYAGAIRLLGDERHLPYQRPPLSKAFLSGDCEAPALQFQGDAYYDKHGVTVSTATRVVRIDRTHHLVETSSGEHIPYTHLVLATGARNRVLPVAADLGETVCGLRSVD